MRQYLELLSDVMKDGVQKGDRTGTGTISIFGTQKKYDLREGFPMVTTKKVRFDAILRELLWFLRGATNINDELTQYTPIWDAWADENGELGPIYGYQWRNWNGDGIDQIQNAIDDIKTNPNSRRIIVSAWNPSVMPDTSVSFAENVANGKAALPPCHAFFQFYVVNGRLDLQLYQRSADVALGVPYNIASYALLLTMVAKECNLTPGIFTHTTGDTHLYLNHLEGVEKQLKRKPKKLPTLKIADKPFWDLKYEDFELQNYEHDKYIKFKISV